MKKTLLYTFLTLAFFVNTPRALGQVTDQLTSGFMNGRFWVQAPYNVKLGYVMGLRDGMTVMAIVQDDDSISFQNITGASNGEIMNMVSDFYEDAANMNIPVFCAYDVAAMKFKGATAAELDKKVTYWRRTFNNPQPETETSDSSPEKKE